MSKLDKVRTYMKKWPAIHLQGTYVVVPTVVLYPSGAVTSIFIELGQEKAQISDGGGAYDELSKAGDFDFDALHVLKNFGKRAGFAVDGRGWIISGEVPLELIASYVALMADASREASQYLLKKFKPTIECDFKLSVEKHLRSVFGGDLKRKMQMSGANKNHEFDFGVRLRKDSQLLLDLVVPDHNSVNSVLVSHLDVKRLKDPSIIQRIVYNPNDEWKSGDLSLLNFGAKTIQERAIPQFIKEIAA